MLFKHIFVAAKPIFLERKRIGDAFLCELPITRRVVLPRFSVDKEYKHLSTSWFLEKFAFRSLNDLGKRKYFRL